MRLAIVDLDERSNQPFISKCGGYIMLFNGEIYNFKELKAFLLDHGIQMRTNSDTEVLLELYIFMGASFQNLLRGMFAIVIYDQVRSVIYGYRDPLGIKPLYYHHGEKGFVFSSQLRAISRYLNTKLDFNENSLLCYKILGSIPDSDTMFSEISSLSHGSSLEYFILDDSLKLNHEEYIFENNYSLEKIYSIDKLCSLVERELIKSVEYHSLSDVPVAVFLSGGLDSAFLAMALKKYTNDVVGITINFQEIENGAWNEVSRASKIAEALGIRHEVKTITMNDFEKDVENILKSMDQPTIDGVNTYYASKFARELGFKVVLSGVGGDELLLGYDFYRTPSVLVDNSIFRLALKLFGNLIHYKSGIFKYSFDNWLSYWLLRRSNRVNDTKLFIEFKKYFFEKLGGINLDLFDKQSLQKLDINFYLRNQLLRDSDWSSMANSIELRTPFVDYRLYESVLPLYSSLNKYKKQQIMKRIMKGKISDEVLSAKKTGFYIPINDWSNQLFGIDWHEKVANHFYGE